MFMYTSATANVHIVCVLLLQYTTIVNTATLVDLRCCMNDVYIVIRDAGVGRDIAWRIFYVIDSTFAV